MSDLFQTPFVAAFCSRRMSAPSRAPSAGLENSRLCRCQLSRWTSFFVDQSPTEFYRMPSFQLLFELNNFHRVRSFASHNQNLTRLDPNYLVHYGGSKR